MEKKTLTLDDIFDEKSTHAPGEWDITWIKNIQVPENSINHAQALKLMTDTARAVDWCGEKISVMTHETENAKDAFKTEWSQASLHRTVEKTAQGKKTEADCDAAYLAKKAVYNRYRSYLEFFQQKQQGFMTIHYAMREIVRASQNEISVANWGTTDDAYNEKQKNVEEKDLENHEEGDLELD